MKRQYDILYAVILVLFLLIAVFIGNAIIKGILLLLFSGVLIFSTVTKLLQKNDRFKNKFFCGILLFFNVMLALGAIFAIASALLG